MVANAGAPTVSGGDGGGSTDTFGATAAYTCNTGFTKNGANPTCGAGGWSAAPTCTSSSCGTYTDVIYHTAGSFVISQTPLGIANGTEAVGTHTGTPAFTGTGDTTPFTTALFTNGMARLRFVNDATGTPMAGTVNLVEWYFPIDFEQTVSALGSSATLTANVDHSVGMLAAGIANCGSGDAACTNVKPSLSRPCAANATGTVAATTLTWGACAPAPNMMTSWNFANAAADTGAGCATSFNEWGTIACTGGLCADLPASELGDAYQTWNQALASFTFSSATYKTATFKMAAAMQIPNATGESVTTLQITSSTVVGTQCGSTPGTDLVCNVQ